MTITVSPGRYSSSNFIQLSVNGSNRRPSRKRYWQSAHYKGRQYHNNHDSSYHLWLNDLVQDYNNAPKVFTIFKVVESQ